MFCNICGSHVDDGQEFCHICGNYLKVNDERKITSNSGNNVNNINNFNNVNNNNNYNTYNGYRRKRNNNTVIILTTILICIVIVGTVICLIMYKSKNNYYFANTNNNANENLEQGTTTQSSNNTTTRGKYDTAIITDNVYYGLSINSDEDAYNLIKLDSVNQKKDDYPKDIIKIENNIIENYSITAVNLKEMDVDFAKEIENVVKTIYNEYPSARKYLTNLTLTNVDMSQGNLLAFFMPVFEAGFSDTPTGAPCVIKTQIELNSKFFLNSQRMDASVKASSKSGHFPKNATRYSPVAHEFGHYLSFIALLNHHSTDHIVVIDDSDEERNEIFFKCHAGKRTTIIVMFYNICSRTCNQYK